MTCNNQLLVTYTQTAHFWANTGVVYLESCPLEANIWSPQHVTNVPRVWDILLPMAQTPDSSNQCCEY